MKLRHEFVLKALEPGANISELAREHGISRKTPTSGWSGSESEVSWGWKISRADLTARR